MNPSTGPLLHVSVSPSLTAARSFLRPAAKFRIAGAPHASASFSHPSSFSPSRSLTIFAKSCVRRRASVSAGSKSHSLPRYAFCSSLSLSSLRMNSAATFLEVGESPAMEPLLARGTEDGGFPLASARLSWAMKRAQVSSLFS